jgi:hypothetical protein
VRPERIEVPRRLLSVQLVGAVDGDGFLELAEQFLEDDDVS